MKHILIIVLGKIIATISRLSNRGNGSTWPGHVALWLERQFIENMLQQARIQLILVVGTNGKTTTAKMISAILKNAKIAIIQNESGANLENGIASTLIKSASLSGKLKKGYAIFEVDENNLPLLLKHITPKAIVVLNLFRDQLDRYGELDSIAQKWKSSFAKLSTKTTLILNADDPLVAYLGEETPAKVLYFGLDETTPARKVMQHASDSLYCPRCHDKLTYDKIYFSHLGKWHCTNCKFQRPTINHITAHFPLYGTYNKYNTLAAVTCARQIGIDSLIIKTALQTITPAFGRQEIISYHGKKVQVFLSKNPTSFNESLTTIVSVKAKKLLLVLNDRIPDGRDISWIWDVDFEEYLSGFEKVFVSGDRALDLGLRLEYAQESQNINSKVKIIKVLENAVNESVGISSEAETLFILPTYSAMLEVRKILTGKKIL